MSGFANSAPSATTPSTIRLATHLDLTAIGPAGLAWSSERLCLNGLRVIEAAADGIRCAGYGVAGYSIEEFTVDPHDGQVRTGP